MPRKNSFERTLTGPPSPIYRPPPPEELTPEERATWNDVVEGMRDSWFGKATLPMLRGYVLIVKQADDIAAELRQIVATTPRAEVLRREHAETMKMMALIGTKLRVCPSSNKSTKDGQRRGVHYPRPWDDWGDDDRKKPWEVRAGRTDDDVDANRVT